MAVPQKLNRITIRSNKASTQTGVCIPLFIALSFTKHKKWKQPKCLLMDEWINKILYILTVEYDSALKVRKSCHMLQHG